MTLPKPDRIPEAVLVTGGAGFIGSALVKYLLSVTHRPVVTLDALTYAASREALSPFAESSRHIFIEGDIRDESLLNKLFQEHRPRAVVNLAAETHVDRSIDTPSVFAQINVIGTTILLEASFRYWESMESHHKDQFRFIHVSTDEVFGEVDEGAQFTEQSRYGPRSPYAASKASADHFVRAFHHTFDFPAIITHSGNNYGPFQFPDKLIPHMVACCLEGKKLPIYGDGRQFRDWIHVEDHAAAIVAVLERGQVGESYLIGAQTIRHNSEIVGQICGILDRLEPRADRSSYREQVEYVMDRPGHDRGYSLNCDKVMNVTNWRPSIAFEEGLEATVMWYLDNRAWLQQRRQNLYGGHRLGLP